MLWWKYLQVWKSVQRPKFREEDNNKVIICPGGKNSWIPSYWRKKEQSQVMSDVFVDRAMDIKPIMETESSQLTFLLISHITALSKHRMWMFNWYGVFLVQHITCYLITSAAMACDGKVMQQRTEVLMPKALLFQSSWVGQYVHNTCTKIPCA